MKLRRFSFIVAMFVLMTNTAIAQADNVFDALHSKDGHALLQAIKSTSDLESRNASGDTPLLVAARSGYLEAIEILVASGANIDVFDSKRRDILNIAITTRNPELAKLALSLGADPTLITSVYEGGAIIYGSARGEVEIVRMLIGAGAPVNRINNLGWTALHEVAILGDGSRRYVVIASMLLDAGADPAVKDRRGHTAYDHARSRGYNDLVRVLRMP